MSKVFVGCIWVFILLLLPAQIDRFGFGPEAFGVLILYAMCVGLPLTLLVLAYAHSGRKKQKAEPPTV